ncbi:hypothetical protein C6P99_13125 [Burkholderia multivorans]|uniref:Bacteriophage protein n=1 Tax=Burkholderia multivorans TaxID=87883 RepID=A0AB37AWM2_9BURK|nr:hypothetical protein [Burkholderia multivorans]PRE48963.1 hypothetical protein C6P99_13125 [Burkholderia multivorans]
MTFSLNPSELFDGFDSFDGFDGFDEPMHDHAGAPEEAHVTSYQAVLQEPMVSLVPNLQTPPLPTVANNG